MKKRFKTFFKMSNDTDLKHFEKGMLESFEVTFN